MYGQETSSLQAKDKSLLEVRIDQLQDNLNWMRSIHSRLDRLIDRLQGSAPRPGEAVEAKSPNQPATLDRLERLYTDQAAMIEHLLGDCEKLESLVG